MKKCIHCGKEIPDEAEFCGFCGTRQPESENKAEPETEQTEIIPTVEDDNTGNEGNTESETADVEETENQEESHPSDETDAEKPAENKEPVEEKAETAEVVNPEPVENTDSSSEENTSSEDSDIKDAEIVEPASEEKEDSVQPEKAEDAEASEKEKTVEETAKPEEPETSEPAENPETSENEKSSTDKTEVKDAETVEPSSEEKENSDTDTSAKEETTEKSSEEKHTEKKKPHFTMPKINLPKINISGEDLNAAAQLIKNPEQRVGISNTLSWLILLFALIANWIAFGSFSSGFCSLVIVLIGLVLINWLTDKEHVSFTATVRNSAEIILAPSVLVLIGGLFIRNIRAGAEIYAFHSIFTTAFIGLFFLSAALILMIITVIRRYEMKIWHVVWILTIFLALLFWYLITSGMFALIS